MYKSDILLFMLLNYIILIVLIIKYNKTLCEGIKILKAKENPSHAKFEKSLQSRVTYD